VSRKKRLLLFPLGVLAVLIGIPCCLTWREVRHERLNQQLIEAIKREDTATALSALAQGADANARDEKQTLPAWKVLWNRLRRQSNPPSTVPTALLLALKVTDRRDELGNPIYPKENLPLIKALLAHGAQVNVEDENSDTPFDFALRLDKNATVRLLIQQGAHIMRGEQKADTFVHAVARQEIDLDTIEMLLQHGADPNAPDHTGFTPLGAATFDSAPERVRLLLRYHADPCKRVGRDAHSITLLSYAKRYAASDPKMRQIVQMLKDAGAKE